MAMDVVDYEIKGSEMQFVEVELDPQEAAVGEAGSMMFMDAGITLDTVFGDGSKNQGSGLLGKLLGAGKRLVTGESLFTTVYTNQSSQKQRVAFAAPYPGKILPMDLRQMGGMLICQKDAFLCAARGVSLGIYLQQKLSVGFFEMGMDSLMSMQLKRRLQSSLGCTLETTVVFDYPNVVALSTYLLSQVVQGPSSEPVPATAPSPTRAAPSLPDADLAQLEQLSEEALRDALAAELDLDS